MTEQERLKSAPWKRFIEQIAESMESLNVSIDTICLACTDVGVTEKDVQDLINGRSVLSREKRMAIAGSLGISGPYSRQNTSHPT